MSTEAELTFRAYTDDDVPFLHNSWGSSYYKGSSAHLVLTPEEFHSYHRPIRERFFSKPNATVIVAANPEDSWEIAAWIAVERCPSALILQYLYVKSAFKGHGLASQLIKRALPSTPILYTHMTERASRIMAKNYSKYRGMRHVPHLV